MVFAIPFRLILREPPRGRFDPPAPLAPPFREVLRLLRTKPAFWLLALGAAASSMMGYGLIFWMPSYFQRSLGLSLIETTWFYGTLGLIGGVAGIWLGGVLGDRLGARNRAAYARVPALAFTLTAPFYVLGLSLTWLPGVFLVLIVPSALALVWLGPVIAAVQGMAPPAMRATASAIFLLINNLIGIGGGTLFLGRLSDLLAEQYGADSLKWAILAGLPLYLMAAGFMLLAARRLERDWPVTLTPAAA